MRILRLLALIGVGASFAATPTGYAPAPNDTYWSELWHLDNRDTNGVRQGIDINVRAAWPVTRGGPPIAIVDDGVELTHPDLAGSAAATGHWNFDTDTPSGGHPSDRFFHGTGVAGMAIAQGNNGLGTIGVAPESPLVSWVIFPTNSPAGQPYVNSTQRAKMFQFLNEEVPIQNHSWVWPGQNLIAISPEENAAIGNAVTLGRGGRGVVMVRAAGNNRVAPTPRNVNEDEYLSDPRVITVAAVRPDGRVASYSTPGAAILVGAPSGDADTISPFSTDRAGSSRGYNQINFATDLADYVFASLWQGGTSSAAPLVSGVAALMLSANPALTYRDVQQILVHASRQADPEDPGVVENGAGFRVSHNAGFGVVDAGASVHLALAWSNRPPVRVHSVSVEGRQAIPDAGLRVVASGSQLLPEEGVVISALPSLGLFPDDPTPVLPLEFVGEGLNITADLTGKGALIRRGGAPFSEKIENARRAGAAFAIVFNNTGTNRLEIMGGTDFVGIPAVFISQFEGDVLASIVTNDMASAQLTLASAQMNLEFTEPLLCEHVRVSLNWEHEQRGDVRVTLVSPMGTRSVLQRLSDVTRGFTNTWTYTSVQHFYESSLGTWRIEVSDQVPGGAGAVLGATLEIRGVPLEDTDADGLDDAWERRWFASLARGPKDDPDLDGYSNAREQVMLTNPALHGLPLEVDLAALENGAVRLVWPSRPGVDYEVVGAAEVGQPFLPLATVPGELGRTAWFGRPGTPFFYRVREKN